MSPFRPDLVEVWIFRERAAGTDGGAPTGGQASEPALRGALEILMLRRSPGRILPGLWQCVSGSLEDGESVTGGTLRELSEETGFGPDQIAAFYDMDQVNQFHEPSVAAILSAAVFAVRVRRDAEPRLSHEHDGMRWVSPEEALELSVWPAYRQSIKLILENLLDPERAIWFELTLDGRRAKI